MCLRERIKTAVSVVLWECRAHEGKHLEAFRLCGEEPRLDRLTTEAEKVVRIGMDDGELERGATQESLDDWLRHNFHLLRPQVIAIGNGS